MKRTLLLGTVLLLTICSLIGTQLIAQSTAPIPGVIISAQSIAVVGVEYKYQVPMPTSTKAIFKIIKSPVGMSIDSLTGLVKWTPTVKGYFSVEVRITTSSNKSSSYSWTIQVVNFLGMIKGVVKNENNELLKGILISLYRKADKSVITIYTNQLSAYTDSVGVYRIVVADSGEFYIQARSRPSPLVMSPFITNVDYIPVWYINSPTMNGATSVLVKDTTPVTANFILKKYQRPVPVLISGTVSDSNGKPISGATIVASLMPSSVSSSDTAVITSFQEPGFGLFCDVGGTGKTDSAGRYKLTVMTGSPYIIASYKKGYILQYYHGKNNVLEADKLTLNGDTTGINFKLSALQIATAAVSGAVVDSAGTTVIARVILYPIAPAQRTAVLSTQVVRTVNTDSLGIFSLNAVANGSYKLQVVPLGKYLPAYYKANDCGVRYAKVADSIVVKENQNVQGLVVCVKKIIAQGGGSIKGSIKNSQGSGLSGVVVIAESQNSCSYDVTGDDGSYEITDLDPGAYSVTTDKVGYTSSVSTTPVIDYAAGEFDSQADFIITEQMTTSVEISTSDLPESFSLYPNYPNPFNPSTRIGFTLPSDGNATLRVFNILGQVVATLVDRYLTAGKHWVTFEPENALSSGVYIYELKYKDKIAVNKMILMK
ncbi:MAG: carboxypeptidase regulatory-like domain-containing protein [Bacteroidota bacterium]|jgi:hypothetical protein